MISESDTRHLLIKACHSSSDAQGELREHIHEPDFVDLLVRIAVDADDQQGDAPMQATYLLTEVSPALTKAHEAVLTRLLETADGYAGGVAIVLGRMKSELAKPAIVALQAAGAWPTQSYAKALEYYDAV